LSQKVFSNNIIESKVGEKNVVRVIGRSICFFCFLAF